MNQLSKYSTVLLRLALGVAFISAVADRFGWWGSHGEAGVSWGDFAHFTTYTANLNWFAPQGLIPTLAWTATVAEVALGLGLILGLFTRASALLSGLMLLLFALAMTFAVGVKAPLNYSVFSAAAAALLLSTRSRFVWSLDSLMAHRRTGEALRARADRRQRSAGTSKGTVVIRNHG